ncbi:MAG: type II toxin-antitoxin system HicA family toxin [Candidatus Pacebacteria bacterium]|nr:type II toxin-antitoxin system HicA family toxin [Candidatus Paceibacterota bacterium]MDD3283862.1 type II toxin-antitoxin system HicA family toxin [Candidatus Paceibacterota bacterium]MDD3970044.1 type II toxin-antitoxin system HicA family toxin [Candidatus Paceibacterota bacterium]MDD4737794.1 type II toxin-antitoxin system HicA family toxin [Candidatus Paceibacterota bacterium]
MPKLRNLSGDDVVKIFINLDFFIIGQKGSHIKLRRIIDNEKQTLTIPQHKELDKGTLNAIIQQSSGYISSEEIQKHFYIK